MTAQPQRKLSTDVVIQMTGVHKWFGDFHVLKDINLSVHRGERIVVCGPSGSGKSTMIRCINRLEEHQKGQIIVDGIELSQDVKNIDMVRREVGMVFQQFNLFPHLTVLENLTLAPMWVRKMPKAEAACASPSRRRSIRASSPAASSSVSPSPARSACSRRSCCSTSRPRPSIRR
jgi:general L-amino acid transport system ATP-binding protein